MLLLTLIAVLLVLATLPGTIELLLLTIASLFHRNPAAAPDGIPPDMPRLAVLIPAHNETLTIRRCVQSVAASRGQVDADIVVIADNCDDDTAEQAAAAGARVLTRRDTQHRGKGYALDFAFDALAAEPYAGFVVVDADSIVSNNFVQVFAASIAAGADAVQCRYTTLNADASLRTRLMNVALMAFNALRPRGRDALGLSAGILGNGFALAAHTLRQVPYSADSVVEDLEYHLLLVRHGLRVRFTDAAWVKADMPTGGRGSETQRARWEGGRLLMLRQHAPVLLRRVLGGNWRLLEPALDLLLLPLAYHVLLLLVTLALPVPFARGYALFALGVVVLHTLTAIRVGGGRWQDLFVLAAAPAYILWKLTVLRLIRRAGKRDAAWVRTEREPTERKPHD